MKQVVTDRASRARGGGIAAEIVQFLNSKSQKFSGRRLLVTCSTSVAKTFMR